MQIPPRHVMCFVANKVDCKLVTTACGPAESQPIIGNDSFPSAPAQCGSEATPQFDTTQGVVKQHDWAGIWPATFLREGSPAANKNSSMGMLNPCVVVSCPKGIRVWHMQSPDDSPEPALTRRLTCGSTEEDRSSAPGSTAPFFAPNLGSNISSAGIVF